MIRFFFRIIGYLLLVVAFVALVLDGVAYLASGELLLKSAGQIWTELAPATLNQAQFAIQEHLGLVWFWDNIVVWTLLQPAFAVIGVLGILFCLLGRRKKRPEIEFAT